MNMIDAGVDSEMFVNENNNRFTNFTLFSSIFNFRFDRKRISIISIIKQINNSIDININFDEQIRDPALDTVTDVINVGKIVPVHSILFVKENNQQMMRLNLESPLFNEAFRVKNIAAADLFKNYNGSIDIDIVYRQFKPCSPCQHQIADSMMRIKNDSITALKFNLESSVFDKIFDSRPILSTNLVKKRDGSVDITIIFQEPGEIPRTAPGNPVYPKGIVYSTIAEETIYPYNN